MHLPPRDLEKLLLHGAGGLAQKRLARGLPLNYPETIALIAAQTLELIRDGHSVAALMDMGRRMLGLIHVQAGVADIVREVQVEGTFADGTKLVTIHDPIVAEEVDLSLALYGSFLPIPDRSLFVRAASAAPELPGTPGQVTTVPGDIELNAGRATARLTIVHTGDRPIQVGSHYPFAETNRALEFDRAVAVGMRLDIPAGTAVRFEPGETRTVGLVATAHTRKP